MNYLDIIFIVPLLWGAYRGFKKGLIIEVATLVALGLGIWGGIHFSDFISELITGKMDQSYVPVVAFSVTFLLIVALVFALGKVLEKFVNIVQLKLINKITGSVFSLLKIALMISVVLVIADSYESRNEVLPSEAKNDSLLYEPLSGLSQRVIPAIGTSHLFPEGAQEISDSTQAEIASINP